MNLDFRFDGIRAFISPKGCFVVEEKVGGVEVLIGLIVFEFLPGKSVWIHFGGELTFAI